MSIQRIIFLVNLGLITLGAYFGVGLFYQILGSQIRPFQTATTTQAAASKARETEKKPFDFYRPILQRDLFKTKKTPVAPDKKTNVSLENIEETKLQLKLWGTVAGDLQRSYAVIEDTKKREQNLYRVGDTIQNAEVKMILRAKVILSVQGKDEVLVMEEVQKSAGRSFGKSPTSGKSPRTSAPGRAQRVSLRRSMINDAFQNINKLMTEIKIQPHMEDGQPAGLALSNIKPNSIFRRMGLRNGDVLKNVDGQEISSVDDALRLYENMKSASDVSVQIQRRGRDRTINYNIR